MLFYKIWLQLAATFFLVKAHGMPGAEMSGVNTKICSKQYCVKITSDKASFSKIAKILTFEGSTSFLILQQASGEVIEGRAQYVNYNSTQSKIFIYGIIGYDKANDLVLDIKNSTIRYF